MGDIRPDWTETGRQRRDLQRFEAISYGIVVVYLVGMLAIATVAGHAPSTLVSMALLLGLTTVAVACTWRPRNHHRRGPR